MPKYSIEENRRWQHSLPGKPVSAGVYLTNPAGQWLIVKPNYRDYWNVPGGVCEKGESPLLAAIREVKEETGISLLPETLRFCLVDYRPKHDGFKDSIAFFFKGSLSQEEADSIVLQTSELDAYKFVDIDEAAGLLSKWQADRLRCHADNPDKVCYLEDSKIATG
jgi:8-oxo-dGTP pyrophosphatase MutT (NUDIX family)